MGEDDLGQKQGRSGAGLGDEMAAGTPPAAWVPGRGGETLHPGAAG